MEEPLRMKKTKTKQKGDWKEEKERKRDERKWAGDEEDGFTTE